MPIDHSDFIARHHGAPKSQAPARRKITTPAIGFILLFLYAGFCFLLAILLKLDNATMAAAGVAFLSSTVLGYFIQKILHGFREQKRELALLREILDASRAARMITDERGRAVFWNRRCETLCADTGTPSLDALEQLFGSGEEAHGHFQALVADARRGIPETLEILTPTQDRETVLSLTTRPVTGWKGYVFWRIEDITPRKAEDRAIREEREKLIDFTDNAPVGFFSVDENGRFVFVNATLARWLGEDILVLLETGTLHACLADPPETGAPYDIFPDAGTRQIGEVRMKGPGGQIFQASINQTVVHEIDGRVRTRGIVHDLTSERAIRQALAASEDRFQRFFEEAPLGIAIVDTGGIVRDYNTAFSALIGAEDQNIEEKTLDSLVIPENRADVLAALAQIEQGQQMTAPMDIALQGTSGPVSVALYARKFRGSDRIVLHFIDQTHQKALEVQFAQSQKMQAIGQLAGGIAHDFNNLLTAMMGFCDLLLLRHKPGDPSFSDIMQIKQNANRAANLVRQLLAFSRQQTLRPRVHDIADILSEISHLLRRLMGASIDLEVVHGPEAGLIRVDEGQMEQVLINLAVNARDAMDGNGRLTISTSSLENDRPLRRGADTMPPGQWTVITVSDTGPGIPPDILPRIFEPFFTTKDVGKGTGLGLATVYGIVRQTGGYLHVDNTPEGGASFSIYLPRASESESRNDPPAPVSEDEDSAAMRDLTGTARILLVEDEDAVRLFTSRALVNKGYEVLAAASGEDAINLLSEKKDFKIDLLVTDVVMPVMDGPTLARKIRETDSSIKIIFISGYTEDKLAGEMGERVFFLPKPFTLRQLAAKVKEVLEG